MFKQAMIAASVALCALAAHGAPGKPEASGVKAEKVEKEPPTPEELMRMRQAHACRMAVMGVKIERGWGPVRFEEPKFERFDGEVEIWMVVQIESAKGSISKKKAICQMSKTRVASIGWEGEINPPKSERVGEDGFRLEEKQ